MKKTMTIATKEELLKVRKSFEAKGFTEVKLLYRAGQYVLTYLTEKVDKFGLMAIGYEFSNKGRIITRQVLPPASLQALLVR